MREVSLNMPLRVLFAIIGAVAILCGLAVGATEIRIALHWWPYWPSLLAALVCGLVVYGGILLLRATTRGRIAVRSTGRSSTRHDRP